MDCPVRTESTFHARSLPPPLVARARVVTSQCGQAERPPPGNPSLRNCRIGVNYLLRRVNPTPHTVLMPPEMLLFGDDRITAAFQSRPPDYVVTAHKDAGEYGPRLLGRDHRPGLYSW